MAGVAQRHGTARRAALGGVRGNEILTSTAGAVLIGLVIAEGITTLDLRGLLREHLIIGLVLIPPVVLKLGSTGYRFARYYTRAATYMEKGPPVLPLRLLAPVLVLSTVALFVSGVLLLAAGHRTHLMLQVHDASFIVFGVAWVPHVLWYTPRVVRSLRSDWRGISRRAVPGAGLRATLVALALGGGLALAVALLGSIDAWHR
jgi:hypothetical protein